MNLKLSALLPFGVYRDSGWQKNTLALEVWLEHMLECKCKGSVALPIIILNSRMPLIQQLFCTSAFQTNFVNLA